MVGRVRVLSVLVVALLALTFYAAFAASNASTDPRGLPYSLTELPKPRLMPPALSPPRPTAFLAAKVNRHRDADRTALPVSIGPEPF